jgi:hypothetical protein
MASNLGFFGSSPLLRIARYARSGRKFLKTEPAGGALSFWTGRTPAIVSGDYAANVPTTSPNAFDFTVEADGFGIIDAGGSTVRQSFSVDVYSRKQLNWTGDALKYVNDDPPVATTDPVSETWTVGATITPYDVTTEYFTDAEGDPLTAAITSGAAPAGTGLDANMFGGTPTTAGSGSFTLIVADIAGETDTVVVNWTVNAATNIAGSLVDYQRLRSTVGGALVK